MNQQVTLKQYRASQTTDSLPTQLNGKQGGSVSPSDSTGWEMIRGIDSGFSFFQAINSLFNDVSRSIRKADSVMDEIGKVIDQLDEILNRIVKNYPPFPQGSEDRVKLLASFNTLRRMIDGLTIPPPDSNAGMIVANPSQVPNAGDWEIQVDEIGLSLTVHHQEVNTGTTGLNIPELSEDAGDEAVKAALVNLQVARETLVVRRQGLASDAEFISSYRELNTLNTGFLGGLGNAVSSVDLQEFTADEKSVEVKQSLAESMIGSITQAYQQLGKL